MDGLHKLRWYSPVTWVLAVIGFGAMCADWWRRKWCLLLGHEDHFLYEVDGARHYLCPYCGDRNTVWIEYPGDR